MKNGAMNEQPSAARPAVPPDHRLTAGPAFGVAASAGIWAAMLAIVALEVVVTYARPSMPVLISALLLLASAQAFLGLMYFMHLRYERAILGWSMVGALLFVLAMMNQLWPDALRVFRLRLHV